MKKNPVHQFTIKDLPALRGDELRDIDFYMFSRKKTTPNLDINYPFRSDFYTLLLLTRGTLKVKANLVEYSIEKNNILILFPGITFQVVDFTEDLMFYGIAFTPSFLIDAGFNTKYVDVLGFLSSAQTPKLAIKQSDTNILCSSLDTLNKRSNADSNYPFRNEIIQHLFNAFLFELAAVYKNNYKGDHLKLTSREIITIRFLKLLSRHYKQEHSVKFYADALFITPKYLSQITKEVTGNTAGYLIDEMIMIEAKILLNDASPSVAQIADELYFADQFVFSKFFKRITGLTPSEYRRQTS